jgi:hypothetical protein
MVCGTAIPNNPPSPVDPAGDDIGTDEEEEDEEGNEIFDVVEVWLSAVGGGCC